MFPNAHHKSLLLCLFLSSESRTLSSSLSSREEEKIMGKSQDMQKCYFLRHTRKGAYVTRSLLVDGESSVDDVDTGRSQVTVTFIGC